MKKQNLKQCSEAMILLNKVGKKAKDAFQNDPEKAVTIQVHIDSLKAIFEPYSKELERIEKRELEHKLRLKETCAREGHIGEWIESKYTRKERMGDLGHEQIVPVEHTVWKRTCTRCGETIETEEKPEEIIKQEKQAKIEELENEIKKLKSEI